MADASLMEAASAESVTFAASTGGGFIWPDFLPAYDAMATLAKLLDLLAVTGRSAVVGRPLAAARAPLPRDRLRRRGSERAR